MKSSINNLVPNLDQTDSLLANCTSIAKVFAKTHFEGKKLYLLNGLPYSAYSYCTMNMPNRLS